MPCQYPWVALIGFITFQELNYHGHTTDTTILSFSFCNLKFQQLMRFSSFPLFTFSLKLIFLSSLSLLSFFYRFPLLLPRFSLPSAFSDFLLCPALALWGHHMKCSPQPSQIYLPLVLQPNHYHSLFFSGRLSSMWSSHSSSNWSHSKYLTFNFRRALSVNKAFHLLLAWPLPLFHCG